MKKACTLLIILLGLVTFIGCKAEPVPDASITERLDALEDHVYRDVPQGEADGLIEENATLRIELLELTSKVAELEAQIARLESNPPSYFDTYNRYQMEKNLYSTLGAKKVLGYLAGVEEKDDAWVVSVDRCEVLKTDKGVTIANDDTAITKYPLAITSYYGHAVGGFSFELNDVAMLNHVLSDHELVVFEFTIYDGKVCMMAEYQP